MSDKKERNYWPHTIIAMILGVIVAGGWTIAIALQNPVQMDTFYMEKYAKVDNNINEIIESQEKFFKKFDIVYSTMKFTQGQNSISLYIIDKISQKRVENANISVLLSRPETNEHNLALPLQNGQDGIYTFGPFDIAKVGRWQILTKVKIDDDIGYNKYETFATP
ncbi:MAG: FixH family protein [Sulfurospirillaceae bacterium]|nr:FixH family protein [Sulfurospirillaceae bacterium]MDD3462710.1 FixH family protein [Sulfurospirillaceae bacterium]